MNINKRDTVGEILNPANGYRGSQQRRGITPKDHTKDNLRIIKEKEALNKEKKEKEAEEKNVFKLSQFQNVGSTLSAYLKNPAPRDDIPDKNKNFLKSGEGDYRRQDKMLEAQITVLKSQDPAASLAPKPSVPKKNEVLNVKPREQKNFINENAKAAEKTASKPKKEEKVEEINPNFGKVPQYIVDRKRIAEEQEQQWRKEQERKSDCPPGMVLMAEEDRLETLRVLEESKKKTNNDLTSLPMICDTMGLKKKKTELENKLLEIEDAMKIFSRKKVYIAE
ncbi:enkurin domain-containing protein [Acrasis kona]|uniref:Enkurin domain-containing protein n=1 Tax=Acrasis kona TaxID=1008807 RepID=A0AAW2ZEW9_9EUKA